MDWWLLTFFIGAILSLFLPEVPELFQLFLLLLLAITLFYHKKSRSSSGFLFGTLWILFQAHLYHNQLPETVIDLIQAKQKFRVEGQVINLMSKRPKPQKIVSDNKAEKVAVDTTMRFNFRVTNVNNKQLKSPFSVRLSWQKAPIHFLQGDILSIKVKLKPVHGLLNVGGFNYLTWLKANDLAATGYVVNDKLAKNKITGSANKHQTINNRLVRENTSVRQLFFNQYQNLVSNTVESRGKFQEGSSILLALTFGDRSSLTKEHWQVFQSTGTSHLIAISGLHIGLLAGGTFFIVLLLFQYLPLKGNYWQKLNSRYCALILSVLFAILYAYLAGFSLPTQRALVMLSIYWLSRLLAIKLSLKRLFLITLFILLIMSPFSVLTASFWLSFYAVAIIFITLWRYKSLSQANSNIGRFIKGLLIIQVALTCMLIPISALFFQKVPVLAIMANIIAVPWMSFISIPAALLSLVFMPISEQLAQWFLMISLHSLSWLWQYLVLLSDFDLVVSTSSRQQLFLLLIGLACFAFFYVMPKGRFPQFKSSQWFVLAILMLVLPFFTLSIINNENKILPLYSSLSKGKNNYESDNRQYKKTHGFSQWQVVFLDVGQGLSVLIKRNGHAILYDTGASYPSGFNMSEAVVLPYLQYLGIEQLDKVILSHSDNDHAGGISQLLNNIAVNEVISNDSHVTDLIQTTALDAKQISSGACFVGNGFSWQGLSFEMLSPIISEQLAEKVKQKNDDSCVVLITDEKNHKVLLTGDISSLVEAKLTNLYSSSDIDVLQVPHHGSKTSSSKPFLNHFSPGLAIVSAGFYNRWNMPVSQVKKRYKERDITLLNNASLGQIEITFSDDGMVIRNYVEHIRPFWFSH